MLAFLDQAQREHGRAPDGFGFGELHTEPRGIINYRGEGPIFPNAIDYEQGADGVWRAPLR